MADQEDQHLRAGEAYLRAIADDPASKMGLIRARIHLLAMATMMSSPEFREALEAQNQVAQDWADALRESVKQVGDELEALHLPPPETLEDWRVLGRIVEIPEDYLQTGSWTAAEVFDRAMAWVQREKIRARLAAEVQFDRGQSRLGASHTAPKPTKPKRSSEKGEGRAKLIAALTKHHKYAEGGCLNLEPIGNNELARQAEVAKRTASAFFDKDFQGHIKYRVLCQDPVRLTASLKALNGEFRPRDFLDVRAPDELDPEAE